MNQLSVTTTATIGTTLTLTTGSVIPTSGTISFGSTGSNASVTLNRAAYAGTGGDLRIEAGQSTSASADGNLYLGALSYRTNSVLLPLHECLMVAHVCICVVDFDASQNLQLHCSERHLSEFRNLEHQYW